MNCMNSSFVRFLYFALKLDTDADSVFRRCEACIEDGQGLMIRVASGTISGRLYTVERRLLHKNVAGMEHSRSRRSRCKAFRGCVENFFFSFWPHEDRVVLTSLYDREGNRELFKKVICKVATPDEVSGLLDYKLLRKYQSLSAADTIDDAGGRSECDNRSEHERGELQEVVDALQPQTSWSNASHTKEHDEEQATDARCIDGTLERSPNEMHSSLEHLQDAFDGAINAVTTSKSTDGVVSVGVEDKIDAVSEYPENDAATGVIEKAFAFESFTSTSDNADDGAADQMDAASEHPENDTGAGFTEEAVDFEIFPSTSDSTDDGVTLASGLSLPLDAEDAERLQRECDAVVKTVGGITGLQAPNVGDTIMLSSTDCGHGDTEATNSSLCGSPCKGLLSAEYVIGEKGSVESVGEEVFHLPCESPCSVSNCCNGELQCTQNQFDKEVPCNIVSDLLIEWMEEEDTLKLKIINLYQQLLDKQKPPTVI
ncbi:hypothetical protein MRX96_059909 [Rhipicephalus microplus]